MAIDGGGIRGVIAAKALAVVEKQLGKAIRNIAGLVAGTSTGSIISGAIASGLSAQDILDLYLRLGKAVFRKTARSYLWLLMRHRYSGAPLQQALRENYGERKLGDFWRDRPRIVESRSGKFHCAHLFSGGGRPLRGRRSGLLCKSLLPGRL